MLENSINIGQYENNKDKTIRIPWDKYEVVLLVDAYNKIANNPENRTNIIQNLSIKLRNRAKNYLHIEVDDTFRNFNGVNMRIGNIKYLFTNGLNGLSSYSQLDKEIYELYKNNYGEFRRIKDIAENQVNIQNVSIDISNKSYESNSNAPVNNRTMLSDNTYFDFSSLNPQTNLNIEKEIEQDENTLSSAKESNNIALKQDMKDIKIKDTDLSKRTINALTRVGIITIYDLINYNEDLNAICNIGKYTLQEINDYITRLNLYNDNNEYADSETISKANNISIKNTELSNRTVNCLLANKVDSLGKLLRLDIQRFKMIESVNNNIINEIVSYINSKGYENLLYQDYDDIVQNYTDISKTPEEIDDRIYNLKINKLKLPQKILNKLWLETTTIGDFITKKNIDNLNKKDIDIIYEELGTYGIKKFKEYIPKHIETPTTYFLKISDVFEDSWIANACDKYNLKNIGLLANVFPDIFLQDEYLITQDLFNEKFCFIENKLKELGIDNTPINLSYFEKEELLKKDIFELCNINYIDVIEKKMAEILPLYISERAQDVIAERYGVNDGQEKTLEEVGQLLGITRERVRQIECNALMRLRRSYIEFEQIEQELSELCSYLGNVISYFPKETYKFKRLLSGQIPNVYIDYEHCCLWSNNKNQYQDIKDEIMKLFDNEENTFIVSQIQQNIRSVLVKYINNETEEQKVNFSNFYEKIYFDIINNEFIKLNDSRYGKKISNKTQSKENIIYWFEQIYKEPVILPQNNEEVLLKNLEPLFEKCPYAKKLCLRRVSEQIIKPNAVFCGFSKYIHINNVSYDAKILDDIIEKIIILLKESNNSSIMKNIFDRYSYECKTAGIDDEYYLIGLIKYKNDPRLECDIRKMTISLTDKDIEAIPQNDSITIDAGNDDFNISEEDKKNIKDILLSDFSKGFRNNDYIHLTKFKTKFKQTFHYPLSFDDKMLANYIKSITVEKKGVLYSIESLLDEKITNEILNFIEKCFNEGRQIIYIQAIYNQFNDDLLNSNIVDKDMLHLYLKNVLPEDMVLGEYIQKVPSKVIIDIRQIVKKDLENFLINSCRPVTKEEIYKNLYNYTQEQIDFCLNTSTDFISNQNEIFFHESLVNINDEQLYSLEKLIDQYLNENEYMSIKNLYEKTKRVMPQIIEKNPFLLERGLKNYIKNKIANKFNYGKTLIFKKGKHYNSPKLYRIFGEKHNSFTLSDLKELSNDLNTIILWDEIYENSIRISQDKFVHKADDIFDIDATDIAVQRFCGDMPMSIKQISHFGTFPDAKYPWNNFLLESFINSYSKRYRLVNQNFAETDTLGAIVIKESRIKTYDDLFIYLLTYNDVTLTNTEIVNYLRNQGYNARKH